MRQLVDFALAGLMAITLTLPAMAQGRKYVNLNSNGPGTHDGSNWELAYTDLQSALNAIPQPSEIWVAAGTYKPTTGSAQSATFSVLNGTRVYGGFKGAVFVPGPNYPTDPNDYSHISGESAVQFRNEVLNETILDGDIGALNDPNDNVYHVVSLIETDSTTFLSGFTIRNGNAEGSGTDAFGGGIFISAEERSNEGPRLNRLRVINNRARLGGGGLFSDNLAGAYANCLFENNIVTDGDGGGAYVNEAVFSFFQNCVFNSNQANCESEGCIGTGAGLRIAGKKTFVHLLNCAFGQNAGESSGSAFFTDATPPPGGSIRFRA